MMQDSGFHKIQKPPISNGERKNCSLLSDEEELDDYIDDFIEDLGDVDDAQNVDILDDDTNLFKINQPNSSNTNSIIDKNEKCRVLTTFGKQ